MNKNKKHEKLLTIRAAENVIPPDFFETTGDRIRYQRNRKGKSAEWLAIQVGCSQSTISQYERNVRDPNPRMLTKIAEALDCSVYSLYTARYFDKYKPLIDFDTKDDDTDSGFSAYLRDYRIQEDEYIRFSISFERLNTEGRTRVFEYLEDIAELPKYQE